MYCMIGIQTALDELLNRVQHVACSMSFDCDKNRRIQLAKPLPSAKQDLQLDRCQRPLRPLGAAIAAAPLTHLWTQLID